MKRKRRKPSVVPKPFRGHVRALKKRGIVIDRTGRARRDGKFVGTKAVLRVIARTKKVAPRKPARAEKPSRVERLRAENVRLRKQLAAAKKKRARPEPKRRKPEPKHKPKPKPAKKPERVTQKAIDEMKFTYEKQFDRIQLQGGSQPDWGWGRRPPNAEIRTDAGSDALHTEALITSRSKQKEAIEYVKRESNPYRGKSYTLSYTLLVRLGDELALDGTNQKTIGRGTNAVVLVFDKLRGEFASPEEAYEALNEQLTLARQRSQFFYLERVLIHSHK